MNFGHPMNAYQAWYNIYRGVAADTPASEHAPLYWEKCGTPY